LSDDVQLLQLFATRKQCFVIVNKTSPTNTFVLESRIRSLFQHPVIVQFLAIQDEKTTILDPQIVTLVPEPYQDFLWPHEELVQLQNQAAEKKQQQEMDLQKEEAEKQRLIKEQEILQQQLRAEEQKLRDFEQAKQRAIAQAHAYAAAALQRNQQQEQQRRQAEFAAQRRQEDQRQRERDAQFRAQVARCGKWS
jgi:hypothetical protein